MQENTTNCSLHHPPKWHKSKEAMQCVIHWQVHNIKEGQQSAKQINFTRKVRDFMRDPVNMTLVETSSLNQTWQQNPDSLAMCAQLFLAIGRVTKVMCSNLINEKALYASESVSGHSLAQGFQSLAVTPLPRFLSSPLYLSASSQIHIRLYVCTGRERSILNIEGNMIDDS